MHGRIRTTFAELEKKMFVMGSCLTKQQCDDTTTECNKDTSNMVVAGVAISLPDPRSCTEEGSEKFIWVNVSIFDYHKMLSAQRLGFVPVGKEDSVHVIMRAPRPVAPMS